MFHFSRRSADADQVKKWLRFTRISSSVTAVGTLSIYLEVLQQIIPEAVFGRFPYYKFFIYAAFVIAAFSTISLHYVSKIITLSVAQIGTYVSTTYILYSLTGVFIGLLMPVFFVVMVMTITKMVVELSDGLIYTWRKNYLSVFYFGYGIPPRRCIHGLLPIFYHMEGLFMMGIKINELCPECKRVKINIFRDERSGFTIGRCIECAVTFNYVEFTCGCCNPDILALCDAPNCKHPGTPTTKPCRGIGE